MTLELIKNLPRFCRTVRYLTFKQCYFQVKYRLPKTKLRKKTLGKLVWNPLPFEDQAFSEPMLIGPERFRFLNRDRSIAKPSDWNNPNEEKLWLYNLHYFDDLRARNAEKRKQWHLCLIKRWIDENPPFKGVGWDPYPLSRRIVNWLVWNSRFGLLSDSEIKSLAAQVRALRSRIEYHLSGNHLIANAVALIFAGTLFKGYEALEWLKKGNKLLRKQLIHQVLPDGGHYERSPMYHAIVLHDLLDIAALKKSKNQTLEPWIHRSVAPMLKWLRLVLHPDGEIGQFNDAALAIAPNYENLFKRASMLGLASAAPEKQIEFKYLPDSGYLRIQNDWATMIADCGSVGPDEQPGHAHAESLSFELSIEEKRFFVNHGISTYQPGLTRLEERGTKAHNTIIVDAIDSSEVWSSFRIGRRARAAVEKVMEDNSFQRFRVSHDGYRALPGSPRHRRQWSMSHNRLIIDDVVSGAGMHRVESHLRIHPEWEVAHCSDHATTIEMQHEDPSIPLIVVRWEATVDGAECRLTPAQWNRSFGDCLACSSLVIVWTGLLPVQLKIEISQKV